jgi:hypothetical protein
MNGKNFRGNNQNLINFLILKAISILSVIYFTAIPLGWVNTKFDFPDVVVLFIILLFNSELLEKLVKLGISRDGITLDLNQIIAEQDSQKVSIKSNTDNIEAITNIVQRLTLLEQQMAENKSEKELIINSLLSEYELKHLYSLEKNESFSFTKQRSFEQELRHLRAFGFIENLPGKTISGMPETGELRDYVKITQRGRDYLKKREHVDTDNL